MRLLFLLSISLILLSCKKDNINVSDYLRCDKSLNLDSTGIINKLQGSWLWTKQSSAWQKGVIRADKKVVVTFNSNRSYTVLENQKIESQGTWKIEKDYGNFYTLRPSQPSLYLYGNIVFCSNELLLTSSYRDGLDFLFVKGF